MLFRRSEARRILRMRFPVLGGALGVFLLLTAVGCTLPPQTVLLEPLAARPVERHPRRLPYIPSMPAPPPEVREEVPPTDWAALLEQLPKDANGAPDWVKALNESLITIKQSLDPAAAEDPVLDLDVELVPKELPDFKVTYPHKIHTQLLTCDNCHPGIFQMERGADPITMDKIFAGEYCGRCHGKVAFSPITGCPRCHRGMPQ